MIWAEHFEPPCSSEQAPPSSRALTPGPGGIDSLAVPVSTLEAISPAAPLQFLPLLAPGVVFGVVKDTIFAIKVDDVSCISICEVHN